MKKGHLGCGSNYLCGWVNADINTGVKADIYGDFLTDCFWQTFGTGYSFLYSEHTLEHLSDGKYFLKRAYDALEPGGVLRVAVPDLEHIIKAYMSGQWRQDEWLNKPEIPEGCNLLTGAEYINTCFYNWGHKFMYDAATLDFYLMQAGFQPISTTNGVTLRNIYQVYHSDSPFDELKNLETRADSRLIFEAVK